MTMRPIDCQPVFLIGAARSGTKFLRDTLGVHSKVKTIPFDINFVWRRGNDFYPHDELTSEMATSQIVNDLRQRMPKMANAQSGDLMLEKTVSNTLRLPFLFKIFPQAKYVHLIRDGRSVAESVFRLWDQPTALSYKLRKLRYYPITNLAYTYWFLKNSFTADKKSRVWGVRYKGVYDDLEQHSRLVVCARQWVKCIQAAERDFSSIDSKQVHSIKYESLVTDANAVQQLCEFLDLDDSSSVMERYRSTVRSDTRQKWRGKWTDEEKTSLNDEMGATLQRLGYGEID